MSVPQRAAFVGTVVIALLTSCAPSRPAAQAQPTAAVAASPRAGHNRVVASIMGEPTSMVARTNTTQISPPGAAVLEQLANSSLTEINGTGGLQPVLAEAVPTTDNGLWKQFPDGRMETSWKIRPNVVWQDGTPLTADDFVFTTKVDQDNTLPIVRPAGYAFIEQVTAPDPQTVTVTWKRPYIDADTLFTEGFASPLPKHLLEDTFTNDKERLLALPYWSQEYVGTGPFKVRDFQSGSSIVLDAFDRYVLGRPLIDEMEIRFILDLNTLMTNVLSGAIELTLGRGFTVDQAMRLRDQWKDGRLDYVLRAWIVAHPQFMNPNPAVVDDIKFRQALMFGTDRQQLVDTMQGGLSEIAHLYLPPSEPEYAAVADRVVRYEYDPQRATQLIQDLGYTKGADGIFRDRTGERLAVELRSNGERITENTIIPLADMWTRLGVATEPIQVPPQRISDREYMATFPGFRLMRQPNAASQVSRLHSSLTPLPENQFVGSNYARYVDPAFDALIDRFLTTIPRPERIQVLGDIMRDISVNLNLMGMFYDADFTFIGNRLDHIGARETTAWDVHKWEVKG
ncbi:MAG TPA: ABC transporter substrate-binding protein [Chloroflexota bacterium]|nr:ABC transporter substrate-binding protein [Chloroflexota bacterium]